MLKFTSYLHFFGQIEDNDFWKIIYGYSYIPIIPICVGGDGCVLCV